MKGQDTKDQKEQISSDKGRLRILWNVLLKNKMDAFRRLGDHLFFLYCQHLGLEHRHQKGDGFPHLPLGMAPRKHPGRITLKDYPGDLHKQAKDAIFRRTKPLWLTEVEAAQKRQSRLTSFDYQTVINQRLSFEYEGKVYGLSVTDPELPALLLAILGDLERIAERLLHRDEALAPTFCQALDILDGLEALDRAVALKAGELMGFWAQGVSRGRDSKTKAQPEQTKREAERYERTRLKIAELRDESFKKARHSIKQQSLKDRRTDIEKQSDLDLLKSHPKEINRAFRKLYLDFLKQYEADTGLKGKKREFQGKDGFDKALEIERALALAGKPSLLIP